MRILLVDTEDGWRGGQQQVLLLATGLAGHPRFRGEAVVVGRHGGELVRRAAAAGLPCAGLPCASPWSPLAVWRLRRLAAERGADVLHAHAAHAHTLCALASLGSCRQLLVTRRVVFPPRSPWKYRRAHRVVAISQAIAAQMRAIGVRDERLAVIMSGVDPARFAGANRAAARTALGLGADDLALLCVAALTAEKDHRGLLQAWARIAPQRPRAHLILAGGGELRPALEQQARGLPRVRFLGFRDDVPELLAAADLLTLPSLSEGLGSTVMDAMTCRLPVVASRAGGLPELIRDGEDGLLVPVGDAGILGDALARLLDDAGLRARLATAAAESAGRRFTAAAMVESYVDLYDAMTRGA